MAKRLGVVVGVALAIAAPGAIASPARAAYPGQNGSIAVLRGDISVGAAWQLGRPIDLYQVAADGSHPQRLRRNAVGASFSPDGTRLALLMASDRGDTRGRRGSGPFRGRASMIAIADAAGRAPRTLTRRGHYLWAQFSRDGQRILFARIDRGRRSLLAYYSGRSPVSRERLLRHARYGLYTMAIDGTNLRRIASIRGGLLGPISLSPNGSQIMLVHAARGLEARAVSRLVTVTADGAIHTITTFAETILGLDFSPQGDRLALALASRRTSEIAVMAASGGALQRLTTTPDLTAAPLWSPDATTIAFIQGTTRRPFTNALYTIPAGGGQPHHLRDFRKVDVLPQSWQPLPAPPPSFAPGLPMTHVPVRKGREAMQSLRP